MELTKLTLELSSRLRTNHLFKVPVIIISNDKTIRLNKYKYMVDKTMKFGVFAIKIRKELRLEPHEALFFFVGDKIIPSYIITIEELDAKYKNKINGFLEIRLAKENTFGNKYSY